MRSFLLHVEDIGQGRYRLTLPRVSAWSAGVGNVHQLAAAFRDAFTEVQVAAHSDWKAVLYDGDPSLHRRQRPKRRNLKKERRDVHPVTAWTETTDGRWRSPGGHLYPPDAQVVMRVRRKLHRAGYGPDPDAPTDELATRRRAS